MIFATFIIQLDDFDAVQRRFGSALAEELLWLVGGRIAEVVGTDGSVGSFGRGQYRIALYRMLDEAVLEELPAALHHALRRSFVVRRRDVYVSASIGVAVGRGVPANELEFEACEASRRVRANGGDATFVVRVDACAPVAAA